MGLGQQLFCTSICATVTDPTGQPITGASIVVHGGSGSDDRTAFTEPAALGRTCVQKIPDGEYSVEASAPGFMHVVYYPVAVRLPKDITLSFRLPLGSFDPLRSTYVGSDVILYGTLTDGTMPASDVEICLTGETKADDKKCTTTNDVGQYTLVMPPQKYRVHLTTVREQTYSTRIEVMAPGYYRNLLSVPPGWPRAAQPSAPSIK